MIKIAICGNDAEEIKKIENYFPYSPYDIVYEIFDELPEFWGKEVRYDVVFLDYEMLKIQRKEVFENLQEHSRKYEIVVYNGCSKPRFEIVELCPVGYFERGISRIRMNYETHQIMKECHNKKVKKFIYVKERGNTSRVLLDEIVYLEIVRQGCLIHTLEENEYLPKLLRKNMDEMEEELGDSGFVRTHNSFLVNMKHIKQQEKNLLEMCCGIYLSISRTYQKQVRIAMRRYGKGRTQ